MKSDVKLVGGFPKCKDCGGYHESFLVVDLARVLREHNACYKLVNSVHDVLVSNGFDVSDPK